MVKLKKSFLSPEWKDGEIVKGGIYRREFDLIKFIKKVEEQFGKVVGIEIEDNNLELLYKPKEGI